jgi:acetoin utilization deacetylase AcuC-like enzyme
MNAIPVFYSEEMLAVSDCRGPGAAKPRPVVEAWQQAALPVQVHPILPASYEDLCVAHDPGFVLGVLGCQIANGFRNTRADVARSLPYTNGAMLCAASYSLHSEVACAPVCGFHHAGYAEASMFCTFNGLMVSALRLLHQKRVQRVLILDTDFHYGNGTDNIIERLGVGEKVENATLGRWYCTPAQADRYLDHLGRIVDRFSEFDLVLYHAGVDLHVDDPLGGVLDTEQMRERDRIVFTGAKQSGTPLAWCLAGGYQEPLSKVVALHLNTMQECVRAYLGAEALMYVKEL